MGAGIRLIPLLVASAIGSTLHGVVTHKRNLTFYTLLAAKCMLLLGSGLLTTVSTSSSVDPAIYGFEVIFGLGIGATFSGTAIVAAINTKFEDYGKSSARKEWTFIGNPLRLYSSCSRHCQSSSHSRGDGWACLLHNNSQYQI